MFKGQLWTLLDHGTDRQFRNVGEQLLTYRMLRKKPDEQRPHLAPLRKPEISKWNSLFIMKTLPTTYLPTYVTNFVEQSYYWASNIQLVIPVLMEHCINCPAGNSPLPVPFLSQMNSV